MAVDWTSGRQDAPPTTPEVEPVWHALQPSQVLWHFGLDAHRGLCAEGVGQARLRHGPNALPEPPAKSLWRTFFRQFKSPLIYILFAAAVLAVALGHHGDARVILTVVLPELASGISAVAIVDAPNLAVGNALGACVVNLLFLVVVDVLQRGQPMYGEASATHLLSAGFGVVMLGFVALSLLTGARAPAVLHVGVCSPLLLSLYLLALRSVHRHDGQPAVPSTAARRPPGSDRSQQEWRRFAFAALVVLVAGSWLPEVADELAKSMGVSRSFVGTVLMAIVTTLPEMAVTLGALRLGALDMAIGNLLGGNLFNIVILAVDDAFYIRGPLLADTAQVHAGTAVTAMVMTGVVIIGLVMRPQGRTLRVLSWISVSLAATYVVNAALVYLGGT